MGAQQSRHLIDYAFYVVLIPYIGRFMIKRIFSELLKKSCGKDPFDVFFFNSVTKHTTEVIDEGKKYLFLKPLSEKEESDSVLRAAKNEKIAQLNNKIKGTRFTEIVYLCDWMQIGGLTWEEICACLGWNSQLAFSVMSLRLLLWHWLQPALYLWIYFSYVDQLCFTQQLLGLLVAVREEIYFFLTLELLVYSPQFFLIDWSVGWENQPAIPYMVPGHGGRGFVDPPSKQIIFMLYVCCPERLCAFCLTFAARRINPEISLLSALLFIFVLPFTDLAAFFALIYGLYLGNLPAPFIIGYGFGSASVIASIVGIIYTVWKYGFMLSLLLFMGWPVFSLLMAEGEIR